MKRNIENILDELIQISGDPLFQKIDILDMTTSVLKARLVIDTDIYIQHKHPIDDPEIHDDSEEASRLISVCPKSPLFVISTKGRNLECQYYQ